MKILTIVGARPQFIKAAVVSRAIATHNRLHVGAFIEEKIVHTGQHFDANMSEVFFEEMGIPLPAHHLGINSSNHGRMTGKMLEKIEALLLQDKPDWVLVYGDTNSTLAGALAAVKLHVPVAHVEAGLRSFNRRMPEEINRVLADHAADLLFTPTDTATANLAREGIVGDRVRQVGDVMFDAVKYYSAIAEDKSDVLARFRLEAGQYILATVHRAENTDDSDNLRAIMSGLGNAAREIPVVLPLHPRTKSRLEDFGIKLPDGIRVFEPVGYLDMTMLEKKAELIATDSGGVQKEAYFHGVPCITLRQETEWTELVELGWNRLAPPLAADMGKIIIAAIGSKGEMGMPYGEGNAAEKIVAEIVE